MLIVIAVAGLIIIFSYRYGYKKGLKDGRRDGYKKADRDWEKWIDEKEQKTEAQNG